MQGERSGGIDYRFAYARAAETRRSAGVGQDFLAFSPEDRGFLFAVCDGVGQSFFGELAAQSLGRGLLGWLSTHRNHLMQPEARPDLARFLEIETTAASRLVDSYPLPAEIPAMLRDVLEDKRAIGSEAMFVCGCVFLPTAAYPSGALFLAWMGDLRVRIWQGQTECSDLLGNVFETGQRWSSRGGLKAGRLNVFQALPRGIDRLCVYSDGLAALDDYREPPDSPGLSALIERQEHSPVSDDISFLDLRFPAASPAEITGMGPPLQPVGQETRAGLQLQWQPAAGADFYQVVVTTDRDRVYQTPFTEFSVPGLRLQPGRVRVRAVHGLVPGAWADVLPVPVRPPAARRGEQAADRRAADRRPADRRPVNLPWRFLVPFAALLAAVVIVLAGAIGFYWVFGQGGEDASQVPAPTAPAVAPVPVEPTPVEPTSVETTAGSAEPVTELPEPTRAATPMVGKLPSPVLSPEPVDVHSGECYIVLPEEGLQLFSQPGILSGNRVGQGTRLTMTGLEGIEMYLDRMWIWVEAERHESLSWVIFGPADRTNDYLGKCP